MKRLLPALMALFLLSSCASSYQTNKFEPRKPIEFDFGLLATGLQQNGEDLPYFETLEELEKVPEANKYVSRHRLLFWPGVVAVGVGTGLIARSVTIREYDGVTWTGLGLVVGGLALGHFSNRALIRAAEIHNMRLSAELDEEPRFVPAIFLPSTGNPNSAVVPGAVLSGWF